MKTKIGYGSEQSQTNNKTGITAEQIFHIKDSLSFPIVHESGFANLCFGLAGIISLFISDWRIVSAFASRPLPLQVLSPARFIKYFFCCYDTCLSVLLRSHQGFVC